MLRDVGIGLEEEVLIVFFRYGSFVWVDNDKLVQNA